jgi:hypothetical protein
MRTKVLRTVVAALLTLSATGAAGAFARATPPARARAASGGPLTGTWTGYISRRTSSGTQRQRITITINARETAGSWRLSPSCHGPLTLDSISDGFHHYRRHVAAGESCAGGDVDCLKPFGPEIYDAVTSHLGGAWDTSGTLRRVRT